MIKPSQAILISLIAVIAGSFTAMGGGSQKKMIERTKTEGPSILLIGTGDTDGTPAIFCTCKTCEYARVNQGKDVRMRTAYRIGETVGIDFGPDYLAQEHRFNLHSERMRHLFFTHSHGDHLNTMMLAGRKNAPETILEVYGNPEVIRRINLAFWNVSHTAFDGNFKAFNLNLNTINYFQPIELKEEDMTVYPLRAWHAMESPTERPNIFVVRIGKHHVLFGNDTGFFPENTWKYLKKMKFQLEAVILDGTAGMKNLKDWHLGGKYILKTKEKMEQIGCTGKDTRWILTHIYHRCGMNHAELEKAFHPYGFEIAYDGMTLEPSPGKGYAKNNEQTQPENNQNKK